MSEPVNVNLVIENLDEFKELLQKAGDQSEQLQKTLQDIEKFTFLVNVKT